MKRILFAAALLVAFALPAQAQNANGRATNAAPTYSEGASSPLSLNLQGALRVAFSGTVTVTGTVAATQSGAWTVTANAGTNLNTSALALEAGGNLAQLVTDAGAPGATACATDTGSCNFNQQFQRIMQRLTTINTTLGTPFQAGGALAANQSVNVAQINGVTPLMGAGNTGTGSPRVTVATDQAALPAAGQGATGAAVPAGAQYGGVNVGGNLTGNIGCGSSVVYDASTNGSTSLVALSGSTVIYVCGYTILAGGTVNVSLTTGTGATCGTGTTSLTPAFNLTAQAGVVDGSPYFRGMKTAAGGRLCLLTSGGVAVQAIVYYTQF